MNCSNKLQSLLETIQFWLTLEPTNKMECGNCKKKLPLTKETKETKAKETKTKETKAKETKAKEKIAEKLEDKLEAKAELLQRPFCSVSCMNAYDQIVLQFV